MRVAKEGGRHGTLIQGGKEAVELDEEGKGAKKVGQGKGGKQGALKVTRSKSKSGKTATQEASATAENDTAKDKKKNSKRKRTRREKMMQEAGWLG